MRMIHIAALAAASLSAACATAISGSAESISRLEQQHNADPESESLQRSLGIAYYKAQRYADARTALDKATSMDRNDGVAALYLGLTAEAQKDLAAAQTAYETYLAVGQTRGVKNQIRARVEAIKLDRIREESRAALAKESQIGSQPASRNTIAVMPFQFSGADTSLRPIERGFAELVTTDMSQVSSLTVVERERMQLLLDEISLQNTQGVTAGTGVRAGRLLQAGRMVGGSIQQNGTQLNTSALVTDVGTSSLGGAAAQASSSVDDIFSMEKNIVLALIQNMGITLTTAERNAIEQRQTRSLAAFLAFGRGLEYQDRGQFAAAAREFADAARQDPSFALAAQHAQAAQTAAEGAAVSSQTIETALRGTNEGNVATGMAASTFTASLPGGASGIADGLNPSMPGAAAFGGGITTQPRIDPSAGLGGDQPGSRTARVTITIRQP